MESIQPKFKSMIVLYQGHALKLTRFWRDNRLALWITAPSQRTLPKMEFVGGYPNEYCIFVENLTAEERKQILSQRGQPVDISQF